MNRKDKYEIVRKVDELGRIVLPREFTVAKQIYELSTGRTLPKERDTISYFIRQSFAPGEISPEEANKIGYKLALEFTGGKHPFIVCTHTDHSHIHNHIIFNSTTLDCTNKFDYYHQCGRDVAKISDRLCLEHGLSVVENPGPKAPSHREWSAAKNGQSWKETLRQTIDAVLPECADFSGFLAAMRTAGYEVKQGKYLSFRAASNIPDGPTQERFTRSKTLGEHYTEDSLRARIGIPMALSKRPNRSRDSGGKVNLLLDLQAKIAGGKGAGYQRWAKLFNLKEMARTLNFLSEHGFTDLDALVLASRNKQDDFTTVSGKMKQAEKRMAEIAALKTHIIHYAKTRKTYDQFKKSRFKDQFRADHEAELLLHEAAKRAFDALGVKKLPTVAVLQAEYAGLLQQKQELYQTYSTLKKEVTELQTIRQNVDRMLGAEPSDAIPEKTPETKR